MRRITGISLIIYALILAISGLFSPARVSANNNGLTATIYDNFTDQYNQFNDSPPLPPTTPACAQTTYSNLEVYFDYFPVCDIWDDFVVKFEGFLTAPVTGTYTFYMHGDDGTRLYFDNQLVEDYWYDTGDGGEVFTYSLVAGQSIPILAWYYENGGGAWVRLEYLEDNSWVPVPSSWFTTVASTTTTTIPPYLNSPQNLSVMNVSETEVFLTWEPPVESNINVERYAIFYSCDNWVTGYGIASVTTSAVVGNLEPGSSCKFKVRSDNDTLSVYSGFTDEVVGVTVQTTTTTTSTTTLPIRPTTTTVIPTTTTEVAVGTSTSVSPPETTVLQQAKQQEAAQAEKVQTTSTIPPSTTTTIPVQDNQVDEKVSALINEASELSKEELKTAIDDVISNGINEQEAKALATNADVVESATPEQAKEIFNAIAVSELSEEDAQKVIEAVQEAPKEVRNAFEEEIDIFGSGKFDTYVPLGSSVSVSQRRVIVAATAGAMLAAPAVSGGPSPSGGSGGSGGPSGGDFGGGSGNSEKQDSNRRRNVRKTR